MSDTEAFQDASLPPAAETYIDNSTGQTVTLSSSLQAAGYLVFINAAGNYYAATSAQNSADSQVANPSANLYDLLVAQAGTPISPQTIADALGALGNGDKSAFTDSGISSGS